MNLSSPVARSFVPLLLLALCALVFTPSATAQAPAATPVQGRKGGKGWSPLAVSALKTLLADPSKTEQEREAAVYRTFGKQSLQMGKAQARIDGLVVGWAVMNHSPARVVDAAGQPVGEMRTIGTMGLQVLVQEVPNFTNLTYRVEVDNVTLLAGEFHTEQYVMPPEAKPAADIPQGKLERFDFSESKIFPNTVRQVVVYTPAQYKAGDTPALFVWQDGSRHADPNGQMRATLVMDHLIAKKQMPVTIGVFIDPGRKPTQKPGDKAANRGFEYDSLGDAYVRMVTEEVLPEVKKRYNLTWSDDPAMRAIAGGSSGGICAFTAAWERPDQFGKVLSWVGSFVNLRGGHVYPALIRITERKPIRVYLLDGRNDLDNPYGNWPLANQNMAAALKFAGYDYRFDYGDCFHGSKGMSASLPEALRWLWRPGK